MAGLALTVATAPPAAAAERTPPATWRLVDAHQRFCTPTNLGRLIYFWVFLDGTWSQDLNVELLNAPPGSEAYPAPTIPPGHGDGHTALGAVSATMPPIPQQSEYVPVMHATSGRHTQDVRVFLGINDDWMDCVNNGPRQSTLISPDASATGR
jgi:hypothetical protein